MHSQLPSGDNECRRPRLKVGAALGDTWSMSRLLSHRPCGSRAQLASPSPHLQSTIAVQTVPPVSVGCLPIWLIRHAENDITIQNHWRRWSVVSVRPLARVCELTSGDEHWLAVANVGQVFVQQILLAIAQLLHSLKVQTRNRGYHIMVCLGTLLESRCMHTYAQCLQGSWDALVHASEW
jgi:hypothetical protein